VSGIGGVRGVISVTVTTSSTSLAVTPTMTLIPTWTRMVCSGMVGHGLFKVAAG